jgi:hypothetical protein
VALATVRVTDDAMYQRAMQTMEACNPVDIGERDAADIGEHDEGEQKPSKSFPS